MTYVGGGDGIISTSNILGRPCNDYPKGVGSKGTRSAQALVSYHKSMIQSGLIGNYERTYGNDKFVTKLNAKELILKKINADTNWVDIYTISLMLGESLDEIGNLMIDDDITELVNDFTTSMFSDEQNYDKVRYVADKAYTSEGEKKEKYLQLLDKVISADEVRILGKILKINQGLPTNTSDLYSYVKSIEKYIESRFNRQILEEQEEYLRIEKELEKT